MDDEPRDNARGVVISELHALDLVRRRTATGLKDVVTGKRYWAHGARRGDPGASDPRRPLLVRAWSAARAARARRSSPTAIDHGLRRRHAGRVPATSNGDGRPDVVVGNKKGTFVFLQVDAEGEPLRMAPPDPGVVTRDGSGRLLNLGFETGRPRRTGTAEGDAFERTSR